jgi:hypothetical protein
MLANDYRRQLADRIQETTCQIAIPRSIQQRFAQRGPCQPLLDDRRRFVRFLCPARILVEIGTTFEAIIREPHCYCGLLSDVSREGVGFLHVQQLYPGEAATVWLSTGKLSCRVVRCRKYNNQCYEIGVVFDDGPQPVAWLRQISDQLAFRRAANE